MESRLLVLSIIGHVFIPSAGLGHYRVMNEMGLGLGGQTLAVHQEPNCFAVTLDMGCNEHVQGFSSCST